MNVFNESSALLEHFEFVKGALSSSASRTDFWIIRHKQSRQKYMLKIFVNSIKGERVKQAYERQEHEVKVYATLNHYLIQQENVRNILFYSGYGTILFRQLIDFVWESRPNNLSRKEIEHNLMQITRYMARKISKRSTRIDTVPEIVEPHFINPKSLIYSYIVTEYISYQKDFGDFIDEYKKLTVPVICNYMAVICTTLFQMAQIGINQNDLHFGNILINLSPNKFGPNEYFQRIHLLVFANKTYIVDNPYTPLIYDFDRASIHAQHTDFLTQYKFGGNCPNFHEKRDFVRFICCAYHALHEYTSESKEHTTVIQKFADKMLDTLVSNSKIRVIMRNDEMDCYLEKPDKEDSFQCDKAIEHYVAQNNQILSFFLKHSNLEHVSTSALLKKDSQALRIVTRRLESNFYKKGEEYLYLVKNIQFVGYFSKTQRETLIQNVYNRLYSVSKSVSKSPNKKSNSFAKQ